MLCIKCGNKIPEGSSFCNRCGNPVVAEPAVISEPPEMVLETPVILPEAPVITPEPSVTAPELPVDQETVIIPQFPEAAVMEQQDSMNQATIVVPEVTQEQAVPVPPVPPVQQDLRNYDTESLEDMYYDDVPEKKSKLGLIIGLVVAGVLLLAVIVVLILGIANNWWRTEPKDDDRELAGITESSSTNPTGSTNPPGPEGPSDEDLTADELRKELNKFTANGLEIYLGDGFDEASRDENSVTFESVDLEVKVSWQAEQNYNTALDYATDYENQHRGSYESFERNNKNGTPYTVAKKNIHYYVTGFYVKSGYVWIVQIDAKDFEGRQDEIINYVTLALVDAKFVPPVVEEQITTQDFTYQGLTLTMDDSLTARENDNSCILENDRMMVVVHVAPLGSLPAATSKEYAEYIQNENGESGWKQIFVDSADGSFYYVSMADEYDMVSLVGMYTYGGTGWIVSMDTEEGDKYAQAMMEYIISGRINPDEVPDQVLETEFNNLKLTLQGGFAEGYRDGDYVQFNGVNMDVFIEGGAYMPGENPGSASAVAEKYYLNVKDMWDNVNMDASLSAPYVAVWNNDATSACIVQGFYLVDGNWWIIRVEATGTEHLDEMIGIATSGIAPEPEQSEPGPGDFQPGDPVYRDRIDIAGQASAEYYGLQVSYDPNWVVDTSWGPTGDYYTDWLTMATLKFELSDLGATDALDLMWKEAEAQYFRWDYYEVGLADGVPYLLLLNNDGTGQVFGGYADGPDCWEIVIDFTDSAKVNEAIWYATAGVILGEMPVV